MLRTTLMMLVLTLTACCAPSLDEETANYTLIEHIESDNRNARLWSARFIALHGGPQVTEQSGDSWDRDKEGLIAWVLSQEGREDLDAEYREYCYIQSPMYLDVDIETESGDPWESRKETPMPDTQTGGEQPPNEANSVYVDSIEIAIMESWPVQVSATVRGNLADGGVSLVDITSQRDGETFVLTPVTERAGGMATMALAPFDQTVQLDVLGLPAGTYTVECNGVTTAFTLNMDNVPQQEGERFGPGSIGDIDNLFDDMTPEQQAANEAELRRVYPDAPPEPLDSGM